METQNSSDSDSRILELLHFTTTHNRHREALTQATGAHFNIFKILRISRREVKTHSPVLAELLNPKGNHGQGAAFLELFLKKFDSGGFDARTTTVKRECDIGPKTQTTGGRIDILIEDDNGKRILIENKIDAADQENQMVRYRNFDLKAPLFYLTLDGRSPCNLSGEELDFVKCQPISYEREILSWLKDCRKEAACLPTVRETITQYIHLVEELTNQSTTIFMNKELIDKIVGSKECLLAFHTLCYALIPVREELIKRLDKCLDSLAAKHNLERVDWELKTAPPLTLSDFGKSEMGFYFASKGLRSHDLRIGFEFGDKWFQDLYFGFCYGKATESNGCPVGETLLSAFTGKFIDEGKPTNWWPASASLEKYQGCDEIFEAICSGDFEKDLDEKLKKLTEIANQVCPDEVATQLK